MFITTNLAAFGQLELKKLELLLTAMREHGLPEDFDSENVHPMLNLNSGYVFLTNDDHQVAMINPENNKLESFYCCPECGHQGFKDTMLHGEDDADCQLYLTQHNII
jgi:hypothetical protein